jgi:hypothetical protein
VSKKGNQAIQEVFRDTQQVTEKLRQGVRAALAEHGRAGRPVATWRDGRVVWVKVDETGTVVGDA